MEQIAVLKQGRWKRRHWSQRVLSLSTLLGVATVSHDGQVVGPDVKSMHVTSVLMWPHYKKHHVRDDFESMEAKLTLQVNGFGVRLGDRVVNGADGPRHVYRYTQRNTTSDEATWVLRFATFADLEKAVHLFQAIRVHPHAAKETEGSQDPVKTDKEEKTGADCAAAATADVEDGDTVAAACAAPQHDDAAPLADELDVAGVTPSTVLEGDVTSDLESIRSQWEQLHRTSVDVA